MEAKVTKVTRVSARFSKSLLRRRFLPNQEKVLSTTQRARQLTLEVDADAEEGLSELDIGVIHDNPG